MSAHSRDDIMKDTEIINFYNNLDQYARIKSIDS